LAAAILLDVQVAHTAEYSRVTNRT